MAALLSVSARDVRSFLAYRRGQDVPSGSRLERDGSNTNPAFQTRTQRHFSDMAYNVLDVIEALAQEKGVSPAQIALAWMLHKPGITAPIIGASKMPHLEQAVAALDISLSDEDIHAAGYDPAARTAEMAVKMAELSKACGLDGVVCSPHDIAAIKQACGTGFLTIVPGVRPAGAEVQDQKRIATPDAARAAGADVLVIGRPITQASDPAAAAAAIARSIGVA